MCRRTNRSGCFRRSRGLAAEVDWSSVGVGKLLSIGEASLTSMEAKYGGTEAKQERFAAETGLQITRPPNVFAAQMRPTRSDAIAGSPSASKSRRADLSQSRIKIKITAGRLSLILLCLSQSLALLALALALHPARSVFGEAAENCARGRARSPRG